MNFINAFIISFFSLICIFIIANVIYHVFKFRNKKEVVQIELSEKEKEYNEYLNLLKAKAKDAIHITEISDNLRSLGQYVEKYPEIHCVEVYEDNDKKIYRLDLK